MDDQQLELRRKRLAYQSAHRGMKEMDLILGPFAERYLGRLDERELDEFEALLRVPDDLLYAWISGRESVPEAHRTDMYERVAASTGQGRLRS